jgi:hypothetical protein
LLGVAEPASSAADVAAETRKVPNGTSRTGTEDAGPAPTNSLVVAATTQSQETTKEAVEPMADISIEPVAAVHVKAEVEVVSSDILSRISRLNRDQHGTAAEDRADEAIHGYELETFIVLVSCPWRQHQSNSSLF